MEIHQVVEEAVAVRGGGVVLPDPSPPRVLSPALI